MPDWRAEIRARLQSLRLSPEREADIVEEVAQHLDDRFRELRAMGRSDDEAAADAWRELEAADVLGREVAGVEGRAALDLPPPGAAARGRWFAGVRDDVRYSLRTFVKNPSFALPVLLAIALSIGPTTAIVSVSDWLMWRPLPGVQRNHELGLAEFGTESPRGTTIWRVSAGNIADMLAASKTVSGISGVIESSATLQAADGAAQTVTSATVSSTFFSLLGLRMQAGRDFVEEDDLPPYGRPVAIISDGLARSAFGDPLRAVGKRLALNRETFEVIGVAPPGFSGIYRLSLAQVWTTGGAWTYLNHVEDTSHYTARGEGLFSLFVIRTAPGRSWTEVEAELSVLVHGLAESYPDANERFATVSPRVFPGLGERTTTRERSTSTVRMLLVIAAVLVVLGCANVANLLVFRAGRREREVAVRKALGASAGRLVQVQLTESWLLAFGGAALGLLIAVVLKQILHGLMFPAPPGFSFTVPLDLRVLVLTLGIATATGLLAGIAPAWMASRAQLGAALGRTARRSVARAPRLRSALASLQLAMSLTLLIGALLLVTTVWNLRAVDLGFSPKEVSSITLDLDGYQGTADVQFLKAFDERANADARFQGVAVATLTPFSSTYMTRILPAGATAPIRVAANGVSDRYFDVLRTPLVRGRAFTAAEAFGTEPADQMPIIIDEPLARRLFGTVDVIGRRVRFPKVGSRPERDLPIIGVARASLWADLVREPEPFVYMPYGRFDAKRLRPRLIVRSSNPVPEIASAVTAISRQLDAGVAISPPWPLESALDREMSQQRLFAWSLAVLGGLGFVLAALGVYGLVAQASAERTREFGIRVAIGASRAHIVGLVVRFAATIAAAGTIGGVTLAYFGSRALASMLFGITALDPRVYLVAVSALAIVVLAACAIPAMRAMRVQPAGVLRME